jgi:CrcB protein
VTPAVVVGIGLLGGVGAVARVLVARAIQSRAGREFPWGIFAVNISGALLVGVLVGAAVGADAYRVLGTGLLGAFTTFSTWMHDTQRLGRAGAALNVALSLVLGVLAVWAGRKLGGQISP